MPTAAVSSDGDLEIRQRYSPADMSFISTIIKCIQDLQLGNRNGRQLITDLDSFIERSGQQLLTLQSLTDNNTHRLNILQEYENKLNLRLLLTLRGMDKALSNFPLYSQHNISMMFGEEENSVAMARMSGGHRMVSPPSWILSGETKLDIGHILQSLYPDTERVRHPEYFSKIELIKKILEDYYFNYADDRESSSSSRKIVSMRNRLFAPHMFDHLCDILHTYFGYSQDQITTLQTAVWSLYSYYLTMETKKVVENPHLSGIAYPLEPNAYECRFQTILTRRSSDVPIEVSYDRGKNWIKHAPVRIRYDVSQPLGNDVLNALGLDINTYHEALETIQTS
jgi:hypothetical protein